VGTCFDSIGRMYLARRSLSSSISSGNASLGKIEIIAWQHILVSRSGGGGNRVPCVSCARNAYTCAPTASADTLVHPIEVIPLAKQTNGPLSQFCGSQSLV
jgi:hypothetical protein